MYLGSLVAPLARSLTVACEHLHALAIWAWLYPATANSEMSNFQSMTEEYRNADIEASGIPLSEFRTLRTMTESKDRTPFGSRLHAARMQAKLSQVALAKLAGMSQSSLAEAEKTGQGSAYTAQLAQHTGVDAHWLASGDGEMLGATPARPPGSFLLDTSKIRLVYVVGKGSGGPMPDRMWTDGDYPVGATDSCAEVATNDPHAFLVAVEGNSMFPRYSPGEFALVEPGTEPDLEDDVLVRLSTGSTMIKRLLSRRSGWRFGSFNSPEVLTYSAQEVTWVYYIAHPVPRRKIKTRC